MVAVAYARWSFTRGCNCKALTGKVSVFWIGGRLWEVWLTWGGGSSVACLPDTTLPARLILESKIKFGHTYWNEWIWKYLWQVIFQWWIQGRGPGGPAFLISGFGKPSAPSPPPPFTLSERLDRPLYLVRNLVTVGSGRKKVVSIRPYLGLQSRILTKQLSAWINKFYGCFDL